MGKRASQETLERLIEQIACGLAKLNPIKVVLFGSFARGDYHEASDFDLLVIKQTNQPFLNRALEVLEAIDAKVHIEPFVYTKEEIERMVADENPLVLDALSQGRSSMNGNERSARPWLSQAARDLDSAKKNFGQGLYEVCCFLCEQAIQKRLRCDEYGQRFEVIFEAWPIRPGPRRP